MGLNYIIQGNMGNIIAGVLFVSQIFFLIQAMRGKYYKYALFLFAFIKLFLIILTVIYMIVQGNIKTGSIVYNLIDCAITIAFPFIIKFIYNKLEIKQIK